MTTETTESPRRLGRYELVHLLGQGGMGEVYLAKISGAAGFEKPCIVKTILPTLLKDRQFLDRFHHEAKVLVHLVHSSIAQVYDMGEDHGTYFMALEYVAGVDVAYLAEQARLQSQAIPVPVSLYLGQKVAEGLGYAHRKAGPDGTPLGIVHRDVSPHNVMVSYEGEVKVIDFGLAKSAARSKYTLPSTVMGKLGYMSPEQARADALDHRSDIYSCGVMVWELLSGQPLIAHGTVGEMMAAMANPRVPSLHELRPEVEPALDAVVRKALAPNPQDRYGRSDEFARALNEQLLRSSSSLGAEEVGNYVKAVCPEAFSAQRQLISRISGVRRMASTVPAPGGEPQVGVSPLPAGADPRIGLEATSVRSVGQAQDAALGATLRPMATPLPGTVIRDSGPAPVPAQALAPVPSPSGPMVAAPPAAPLAPGQSGVAPPPSRLNSATVVGGILILLLLMVGTAIATVHFMGGPPPPPPLGEPSPRPGDRPPPPRYPPPPDRGDWRGPPHGGPEGGPPGEPGGPRAGEPMPPPPEGEPPPEPGPQGLAEKGEPDAPALNAAPEPAAEPAAGKPEEAPSTPKAHASKPREKALPSLKDMLMVRQVNDVYFAMGPGTAQLREDMVLQVVGAKQSGKLKLVGTAKVVGKGGLRGKRVRLELDDAAKRTPEPLFALMPEGVSGSAPPAEPQPEAEAPAPVTPPPAPPKELNLFVRQDGILSKEFVIDNRETTVLSRCTATVTGKKWSDLKTLRTGKNRVDVGAFKVRWTATDVPKGMILIECAEGRAQVGIRG